MFPLPSIRENKHDPLSKRYALTGWILDRALIETRGGTNKFNVIDTGISRDGPQLESLKLRPFDGDDNKIPH